MVADGTCFETSVNPSAYGLKLSQSLRFPIYKQTKWFEIMYSVTDSKLSKILKQLFLNILTFIFLYKVCVKVW